MVIIHHHYHHHKSFNREGRWGTTDDFTTKHDNTLVGIKKGTFEQTV